MCPSKFKELWKKKIWPYFMSLSHIWQRVLNASIFWRSSYIAYPFPFFKFFSTPLHPCCLQSIPSLVILLSCLFCWMGDHSIFDVLLYLMISWTYTCRALGPWCMFYATRHHAYYCCQTHVVFCWLIWYHTHINAEVLKDTFYTQGPVDWYTHTNIYLYQLYVLTVAIFITLNE